MTAVFYFSDRPQILAQKLDENITNETRASNELIHEPGIVIPNRNLKRWVELYLADSNNKTSGILANWKFTYLESWLMQFLAELNPGQKPLTREKRMMDLLGLFNRASASEFSEIQKYYNRPAELHSVVALENLKLEMVEMLTSLFEDYERHRHMLLYSWIENDGQDQHYQVIAKAKNMGLVYNNQKELYLKWSQLNKSGYYHLLDFLKPGFTTKLLKKKPSPVHIFGLSQISSLHLHILDLLSQHIQIYFYIYFPYQALSTSHKDWEDIKLASFKKKEFYPGNLFSCLFDQLELFQSLFSKSTCQALYSRFDQTNDLGKLQFFIQRGQEINFANDQNSIQILEAKTKREEIQAIYESIIDHLNHDINLKLHEIAILVPDMESYRSSLETVFDTGIEYQNITYRLPYNLSDFSSGNQSYYYQATLILLKLFVEGTMTRKDFIQLIQNPCFKRDYLHADSPDLWTHWIEKLNIFESDAKDNPYQSWRFGCDRLILGQIMHPGSPTKPYSFRDLYPWEVNSQDHKEELEKFCNCIDQLELILKYHLAPPQKEHLILLDFINVLNDFLEVPESQFMELKVQNQIQDYCMKLNDQVLENECGFNLRTLQILIKKMESEVSGNKGKYLIDGITISSLQPMRPVPYKIIYLPGMGDDFFPGHDTTSLFNLKQLIWQKGDMSLIERNTVLFFESIMSVSHKIYFSFINQDSQKDTNKEISTLVRQLMEFIKDNTLLDKTNEPSSLNDSIIKLNRFQASVPQHQVMEDPLSLLNKITDPHKTYKIDNTTLSMFLKDPVSTMLNLRYNFKVSISNKSPILQKQKLFTPWFNNFIMENVVYRYLGSASKRDLVQACEIFDDEYNQAIHKGSTPAILLSKLDQEYIKRNFIALIEYLHETLDWNNPVYTNYRFRPAYNGTCKTPNLNQDYNILFALDIPVFQYSQNVLHISSIQNGKKSKQYIDIFSRGILFFYLKPDIFIFDPTSQYEIHCNVIYPSGDKVHNENKIKFQFTQNELDDFIQNQLASILEKDPDWIDFDLLFAIDNGLKFSHINSDDLIAQLEEQSRLQQERLDIKKIWREYVKIEFANDSLDIIHKRWEIFRRGFL